MRVRVRSGADQQACNPGVTGSGPALTKRVKLTPGRPAEAAAPVAPAPVPTKPAGKPIVNCYWAGDAVVLVHPDRTSTRVRARFSLFVRTDQLTVDLLRQLKGSRAVRAITAEAAGWSRIECPDLDYRQKLVLWLEKEKRIPTFEGDLNPVRRYLVDEQPTLAAPRSCYIDIETDSRVPFSRKEEMRILIVSIVDGERWRDPTDPRARRRYILPVDTDEAEEDLLKWMWSVLAEYDQVIAWSGAYGKRGTFDFEVIEARTKKRGLNVPIKRWLWLDHLELFRRMNMSAAESGEEKQSMKLGVIAQGLIGETKHDFDASKTWEAWEAGGDERIRLADYCDQDTLLMPKIEEATGYIALLQTLCEVTGTFADTRGISPQQQVDSFMLTLAKRQHYRPHTRIRASAEERESAEPAEAFEGAYVMQPRTNGIERDVHVCDFAAMYPSIILSYNMSPETKRERPPDPNKARPSYLARVPFDPFAAALALGDVAVAPGTEAIFSQAQPGILPLAITELIRLRKYWNDLKSTFAPGTPEWKEADRRSTAYKIAGNSFYGVAGSPSSLFFDREVAESVSRTGQWLIKSTIAAAEQRGMRVIYADTDSAFVCGVDRAAFEAFVAWCNAELYPVALKQRGCIRNHVKLAYEKQFERVVFTSAKKYCNPPETPMWMADMSFKRLGDIAIGDRLVGWSPRPGTKRRLSCVSEVVAIHRRAAPIVKVTFASGRTVRCTADHRWLSYGSRMTSQFVTPKVGRKLVRAVDVPAPMTPEEALEASWLGGIYDGEGSLSGRGRSQIVLAQSPAKNPEVCARIERVLQMLKIPYAVWDNKGVNVYAIQGSTQAKVDFINRCRPAKSARLAGAAFKSRFGNAEEIVSIEPDGEGEVIGLTTTTGNYFAWGFASKNCGVYVHYKGKAAAADSKPEIRGLEYKRGDASRLTRGMQGEAIELLMGKRSEDPALFHQMACRWRDRILTGELPIEDIKVSKTLTKPLRAYVVKMKKDGTPAAQPPHVAVAHAMKKRGLDVGEGTKIDYVCIDGNASPKRFVPADEFDGTFDRHELWESTVYPATQRLLEAAFPKGGWEAYERTRPAKQRATRQTAAKLPLDLFEHAAQQTKNS